MRPKSSQSSVAFQRGIAALSVTMLLLFAMLIVVAATNRNVVVETHASANQLRSTQAFEAAEAGLEWALARLNDDTAVGDDCLPSAVAGARSFRERMLSYDEALPGFRPATWDDAGTARPQQVACEHGDAGWSCSCPAGGLPLLPVVASTAVAPVFAITFSAGAKPGIVVASAAGCTRGGAPCLDAASAGHEATTRLEVAFGLLPGLRATPLAAMTVKGNVDTAAALGVRDAASSPGGVAVHAGGHIAASALRLDAPTGSSLASADTNLAMLAPDRLFARWFATSKATWSAQPAVQRVSCEGDCTAAIATAIATGHRLLAVHGDTTLRGPIVFGSVDRPVVIVVDGAAHLSGNVVMNGLLYAGAIEWNGATAGALIEGALVCESDYTGDAQADIVRDDAVLARLRAGTGTFARVSGSWKDF